MQRIILALDWTPNTVHTGILIALSKRFYEAHDLDVHLLDPSQDDYSSTPAKKLIDGQTDLAICPSESVIAYAEQDSRTSAKLTAIFALLDSDASSILCNDSITRAKDLDGKIYGSYNARYEDSIVRAMIKNDGGSGAVKIAAAVPKLSLFQSVLQGDIDATWIFSAWEGIEARQSGFKGTELWLGEYGIPYGYSPLIVKLQDSKLDEDTITRFLQATRQGYAYAVDHADETVEILRQYCPVKSTQFLRDSLTAIQQHWARPYGFMNKQKWSDFVAFLRRESLTTIKGVDDLFTNRYFGDS